MSVGLALAVCSQHRPPPLCREQLEGERHDGSLDGVGASESVGACRGRPPASLPRLTPPRSALRDPAFARAHADSRDRVHWCSLLPDSLLTKEQRLGQVGSRRAGLAPARAGVRESAGFPRARAVLPHGRRCAVCLNPCDIREQSYSLCDAHRAACLQESPKSAPVGNGPRVATCVDGSPRGTETPRRRSSRAGRSSRPRRRGRSGERGGPGRSPTGRACQAKG